MNPHLIVFQHLSWKLGAGLAWLVLAVSVACGPPATEPEPPRTYAGNTELDREPGYMPESVEWIYATSAVRGGKLAECKSVVEWLRGEQDCKGAGCQHGVRLAKDWLLYCREELKGPTADVEGLSATFGERSAAGETKCTTDGALLQRDGCKGGEDLPACMERMQAWTTRCAEEVGSPLLVYMLEQQLRQADPERKKYSLDVRSCGSVSKEIREARYCENKFKCEDALELVKLHTARCTKKDTPLSVDDALAQLAVRVGAGEYVQEMAVMAPGAGLAPPEGEEQGAPELVFARGHGGVLSVCDARVKDLGAYLGARRRCTGELVFARVFQGDAGYSLRVGRFDHSDDLEFFGRFPQLRMKGEAKTRSEKEDRHLSQELQRAAALGKSPSYLSKALKGFISALARHRAAILGDTKLAKTLAENDKDLVPLFIELGKQKAKLVGWSTRAKELVPFARRAEELPLSDVTVEGEPQIGAQNPALGLGLTQLPECLEAYRGTLKSIFERAKKRRVSDDDMADIAGVAGEQAKTCADEEKQVRLSSKAMLECNFGVETCSPGHVDKLADRQQNARTNAVNAWTKTTFAIHSLDPDNRASARGMVVKMGCEEPWW